MRSARLRRRRHRHGRLADPCHRLHQGRRRLAGGAGRYAFYPNEYHPTSIARHRRRRAHRRAPVSGTARQSGRVQPLPPAAAAGAGRRPGRTRHPATASGARRDRRRPRRAARHRYTDRPAILNATRRHMKKTQNKNPAIAYAIVAKDLSGHLFQLTLTIAAPAADGQLLVLPAWIPGSYMIREFARNIVQISAEANGKPVALTKLDKHSWQAAPCQGPLTVEYDVYAWDLSVRAAHLDQNHGFFNGTSVFLSVHGQEQEPHEVNIVQPKDAACKTWRVATSLPELKAKRYGFGSYQAANYDELIDHPVEMGDFALATFKAHGVPHDIVFTGKVPNLDLDRLCRDLKAICETQIAFFEPKNKKAPMDRYVFMTMVVGDGYGGLEHRASTALVCARADLPTTASNSSEISDGYLKFLGLCSHEYFHTWNVKRIKPAAFAPYQLQAESYSPLLWLFEGFTSYYDDLMLVRAGLIDEAAYFKLLGKTVNSVLRGSE